VLKVAELSDTVSLSSAPRLSFPQLFCMFFFVSIYFLVFFLPFPFSMFAYSGALMLLVRALRLDVHAAQGDNPVVFVGPYEHHSNILPWRESCATLVTIGLDW
jgi:hypothetical protein